MLAEPLLRFANSGCDDDLVIAQELLGDDLCMQPMFEPKMFGGKKKIGKYSFTENERTEIFSFAIDEIRKHMPKVTIALYKELASVWDAAGLELSRCACVCQLEAADILSANAS